MSPVTDPIGDLLTRMRNAQHARHGHCCAPWSLLLEEICAVLKREGWIQDVEVKGEFPKRELVVTFHPERPVLALKRISKPGQRIYVHAAELKSVLHGFGMAVLTTNQGLMTDREARKKKIGGEVLCTIS